MDKNYVKILKKYDDKIPYYSVARECLDLMKETIPQNQVFYSTTVVVTAPVLVTYVWWVLHEAKNRGISRLYFLARDGYILHKIANHFCDRFNLDIECKYLYCSRASLRLPTYHFIGDEAYKLLFLGGYSLTPNNVLHRIQMSDEERREIYLSTGIEDENKVLSKAEFKDFCNALKSNKIFTEAVRERSIEAYNNTIGYLKQEGLFDRKEVAIVDSGWTGSMQRSLRQLLSNETSSPELTGFYFGLYTSQKEEDGVYLTWYFSHYAKRSILSKFNNNLFECLCSAPHAMTIGYSKTGDRYVPIFKDEISQQSEKSYLINLQIEGIINFTERLMQKISFDDFDKNILYNQTKKLLQSLMYKPSPMEAYTYGTFTFCDDISEYYKFRLADESQEDQIKSYLLIYRIHRKLFARKSKKEYKSELYWPYGSLALSNLEPKWWYRLNLYMWDMLRYYLSRR